jgi:hypothetical protein
MSASKKNLIAALLGLGIQQEDADTVASVPEELARMAFLSGADQKTLPPGLTVGEAISAPQTASGDGGQDQGTKQMPDVIQEPVAQPEALETPEVLIPDVAFATRDELAAVTAGLEELKAAVTTIKTLVEGVPALSSRVANAEKTAEAIKLALQGRKTAPVPTRIPAEAQAQLDRTAQLVAGVPEGSDVNDMLKVYPRGQAIPGLAMPK